MWVCKSLQDIKVDIISSHFLDERKDAQIIVVWGQRKDIDLRFPIALAGLLPPRGSVNELMPVFSPHHQTMAQWRLSPLWYWRDRAKHFCQNQTEQNTIDCFVKYVLPHHLTWKPSKKLVKKIVKTKAKTRHDKTLSNSHKCIFSFSALVFTQDSCDKSRRILELWNRIFKSLFPRLMLKAFWINLL